MTEHASSQGETKVAREISDELRQQLAEQYPCYVLITCSEPSNQGDMKVDMWTEGDPVLAAYLLEGALQHVQHQCYESDLTE